MERVRGGWEEEDGGGAWGVNHVLTIDLLICRGDCMSDIVCEGCFGTYVESSHWISLRSAVCLVLILHCLDWIGLDTLSRVCRTSLGSDLQM